MFHIFLRRRRLLLRLILRFGIIVLLGRFRFLLIVLFVCEPLLLFPPLLQLGRVGDGHGAHVLVDLREANGVDGRRAGCTPQTKRGELGAGCAVRVLRLYAIELLKREAVVLQRLGSVAFQGGVLGKFDKVVRRLKQTVQARRRVGAVPVRAERPVPRPRRT